MKRIIAFILLLCLFICSLVSCRENRSAEDLLCEFIEAYGADGIIYSMGKKEYEDGYVSEELLARIYVYQGDFPENFAIFLNSHADYGSECAVFVSSNAEETSMIVEMCQERISLLGRGSDIAFIKRKGNVIFYSTMSDREKAEKIWAKIL